MREIRQNTATRITVGPFLDKTDGITPETSLTVTSEKLTLVVDTGGVPTLVLDVAPTASGGANDMVHITGDDAGYYDLELAAANVNYVGRALLSINDVATHCPVFHEIMILPEIVYDSKYPAGRAVPLFGVTESGTLQSATSSTAVLAAATSIADDLVNNSVIEITSGTGVGQVRFIVDWVSSTDTATVNPNWATTPDNTSTYILRAAPPSPTTAAYMPSVMLGADALTDAALAADAVTAIQSGLATQASVNTIDDLLDSEMPALTIAVADLPTNAELATALGTADDAVLAALAILTTTLNATRYQKNAGSQKVFFILVDSTDHVTREPGITVTATRSLDGAAFGAATGTVTEVASGVYYLTPSAGDINADDVVFRFTGTGCDPVELHVVTY